MNMPVNLVCPTTKERLVLQDSAFVSPSGKKYRIERGIPVLVDLANTSDSVKDNLRRYYAREAAHYNVTHGSSLPGAEYNIRRYYFPQMQKYLPPGAKILEFGSGTGRFTRELKKITSDLVVTDISIEMLLQNNDDELVKIVADTEALPFLDHSFGACFGATTFSYLPDKKKALLEIKRVLKPGGRFFIIDMNRDSLIFLLSKVWYLRHRRLNRPRSIQESNLRFVRELLVKNGFQVDGSGCFSWVPHASGRLVTALLQPVDVLLSNLPFIRMQAMRFFITGTVGT